MPYNSEDFEQSIRQSLEIVARKSIASSLSQAQGSKGSRESIERARQTCILDVQELNRLVKRLSEQCMSAKHNKEAIGELLMFVESLPFYLMEELACKGAVFDRHACKLIRSEISVAEQIVEKHSTRSKVVQLLNAGEVEKEMEALKQRIAIAFELLGVQDPIQPSPRDGGGWKWTGVWVWIDAKDQALARRSADLHASGERSDFNARSARITSGADVLLEC